MDQQSSTNNNKSLSNPSSQRTSLQITDRRHSTANSSRTVSPIAFFHDGIIMNDIELHNDFMRAERRARAIATAPRRKRHDDDKEEEEDDNENKKTLLDFIKTSAVPISIPIENQKSHSLPQTQSGIDLLPRFRIDPPSSSSDISNHRSRHRNLSVPPTNRKE